MKSRQRWCLILYCFCAILASFDVETKPNVILIMADDVGQEAFGCYGAEDYRTPVLDGLASKGVRFTNCYSTPICTPSRVQIMTGKYSFRNYTHFGYLNPDQKTFGHLMQAAGYRTAIAGKWQLNGLSNNLPGYDDDTRPNKAGFHEYCLWQLTQTKAKGERFWSPLYEHNGKILSKELNTNKYGPDIMCDFLCDFIERNKKEPFFVYYPMVLVHDPFVPTPDTIGDALRSHSANRQPKDSKQRKANFVAMVQYMDKIVGRIVDKVDSIGQLENTIIMFTADNGTHPSIKSQWKGQTIKGGKGGMKDNGTHVPLIAYWKGHTEKSAVLKDLVDFTDFYPTLAEAAEVKPEKNNLLDGRSFLPRLKGEAGSPRDWVLLHYQPYWGKKPGQFARTANFKLYRDGRFYEVPVDLDETNDISGEIKDERLSVIHGQLNKLLKSLSAGSPGEG